MISYKVEGPSGDLSDKFFLVSWIDSLFHYTVQHLP